MEDRIQGPQITVAHDLAEILFGSQESRSHPAFHHAAVDQRQTRRVRMRAPECGLFDDVRAGQAAMQRGRYIQTVDGETILQPFAQAGCGRRIVALQSFG